MTTDINNLAPQGLNSPSVRQLNVPSEANDTNSAPVSGTKTDNIVRLNFGNRQAVAIDNQSVATSKKEQLTEARKATLTDSVKTLSRSVQSIARTLEFHVDETSGKTVITVLDSDSKEIIRQIPSDQLLQVSARLKELQEQRSADPTADIAGVLFTGKT